VEAAEKILLIHIEPEEFRLDVTKPWFYFLSCKHESLMLN